MGYFAKIGDESRIRSRKRLAAAAAASLIVAGSALAQRSELSVGGTDQVLVRNVESSSSMVTGVVENRTSSTLRDVRLEIRHVWYWNNERSPGEDNPGRTEYFLVHEEVPPRGEVRFAHRIDPPLPERADGYFKSVVSVASFTEIGVD